MEALKQEIQRLMAQPGLSFAEVVEGFAGALQRHPETLGELAGRYRLQTTDTNLSYSFALTDNRYQTLGDRETVDVAISGREADLLRVLHRELNPAAAMFTGKLRVQGSMQALGRFAQLL